MIIPKNWSTMKKLMFLQQTGGGSVVIEDTVSGNPVVFTTDLSKPLKRLSLSLLPRQSGTGDPSPSNIRPLLPWGEVGTWTGGANICYDSSITFNRAEKVNGEYRSTDTDTRTRFLFAVQLYDANKTYIKTIGDSYADIGIKSRTFTVDDANVKYVCIKHVGAVKSLIELYIPFNYPLGEYTVSADVVGNDPTVVGGIRIKEIQLSAGDTVYPYAEPTITPHPVNLQKNLLPSTEAGTFTHNGITFTADGNGGYTMDGESTATAYVNIPLKQAVTLGQGEFYVHLMNNVRNSYIAVAFMNGSSQVASASFNAVDRIAKIDALSGATFDKIRLYVNGTQKVDCKVSPMLCLDSTATAFQPYLPPVYGCELVFTSEGVQVWGTWRKRALNDWDAFNRSTSYTHPFFYGSLLDRVRGKTTDFMCEVFKNDTVHTIGLSFGNSAEDNSISFSGDAGSSNVYIRDDSCTTREAFLEKWGNAYLCYKLATPVLLATLTAQQVNALVGVNTVWSDADNIELTFLKKR